MDALILVWAATLAVPIVGSWALFHGHRMAQLAEQERRIRVLYVLAKGRRR